ncbi:MAG: Asp-tRNA(Asn)/Glu-tRNA(Gln) amidotransferase subunit GatC [Clostridia bacterium]|nr:Asp-tRNA(Asn)/Glu-tRNA(Gln) amidotransferase subunit GatC [Clostridia bacterium]
MAIEIKEIEHLADLARLALSEKEKEQLSREVGQMIEFADKLSTLDTTDTDPTMFAANVYNVFREDEAMPSLPTAAILQNAPSADMECFVVPKTVE